MKQGNKVTSVAYLKVEITDTAPVPPERIAEELAFDLHWLWPYSTVKAINHNDPRA